MILVDTLYSQWYMFILAILIACVPVILSVKIIPEPKRFLRLFLSFAIAGFVLFYFVIPTPITTQSKYVAVVQDLRDSNSVGLENIVKMQNRYCSLPYLNGIAYFQFLTAYRKDFKLIINEQGTIPTFMLNTPQVFEKQKICDVDVT